MAPRKPLDVRTLRAGASYVARRLMWAGNEDNWEQGFNSGIRAAARHLRNLANEQQARTRTPAKKRKR